MTLVEFLKNPPCNCRDIQAIVVTIGKARYENAARYKQDCIAPAGCARPGPYTREAIYVVGLLPKEKLRGNVCFTVEGDKREWYIAGYFPAYKGGRQQPVAPTEQQPFGATFILMPYDPSQLMEAYRESKVDTGERHPYKRVPMKVEPVAEPAA